MIQIPGSLYKTRYKRCIFPGCSSPQSQKSPQIRVQTKKLRNKFAKKKAYDPVSLQICIHAIHPWLTGQVRYDDGGYAFVCSHPKSKLWIHYYQKLIKQAGDFIVLRFTESFYEEMDRTCLLLPDFD